MLRGLPKNSAFRRSSLVIWPYNPYSESARLLASNLGERLGKRVLRVRSGGRFKPRYGDWILNWGNSNVPDWANQDNSPFTQLNWLNKPHCVARASNKLITFNTLAEKGIEHVQYTSNRQVVQNWLDQGRIVFARTFTSASGGKGIDVLRKDGNELPRSAPLYTLYQRKDQEFRVHVFRGEVIDVTEKRRVREFEQSDDQKLIRNHDNGWVFCRDGISEPRNLRDLAIRTVNGLGLSFGAVDIISDRGDCYVLEVNTAPGIEGTTLDRYVNALAMELVLDAPIRGRSG
mgnify:CR=1 FL=1